MATQRGSVLPGVEIFEKVLNAGKTLNIGFTLGLLGVITQVEVPDFSKGIIISSVTNEVAFALDEDPVIATTGLTDISVTDMGIGILVEAGAVSIDRVFCFDIHGISPKKLRFVSSVDATAVNMSFF